MHDLLIDELIGVRSPGGERHVSLPMLLALLAQGAVDGYTGLRPHQADPWHVFLVQLAGSIQARRPTDALPTELAYWREGLLDLADGQATAWSLVVDDVTKPAFLQHPWKGWEAEAKEYGVKTVRGETMYVPKASTPDELDVLITSRNHDVKMARMGATMAEAWIYALLMRQTMSAYSGGGGTLNSIARMNSGAGSRPIVAWVRDLHPAHRFRHEVGSLQKLRARILKAYGFRSRGTVLTWLECWDRSTHQYFLNDLEPWFIEAARPIRLRQLQSPNGPLIALGTGSGERQIGPKKPHNGDVGDPWIPINVERNSALTVSAPGFTPSLLTKLIFKDGFALTELQEPATGDGLNWFVASVLVGGNCTTDGFYRIELPVPPKAHLALFNKQCRDTLAHLAQALLIDAKTVQKALGTALTVLAEGGPEQANFDRDAVKRWVGRARIDYGRHWEKLYFSTLWRGADEDHAHVRTTWQQQLVNQAQALLDEAAMRLPLPSNRYWRAITQAHGALRGSLRKQDLPLPGDARVELAADIEETPA